MSHKVIDPALITKTEEELGRLRKAIDRIQTYASAADNKSVKLALQEVKKVRVAIIRQKNESLDACTREGLDSDNDGRAKYYRGYEKGLSLLIDSFENTEEELRIYNDERDRLESQLAKLRKMQPRTRTAA